MTAYPKLLSQSDPIDENHDVEKVRAFVLRKLPHLEIELIHTYTDRDGKPIYWRCRLWDKKKGEKTFLSVSLNERNEYQLKEPKFEDGLKPLYRLHLLVSSDDPVWAGEGEKCVEGLESVGLVATTSGGSQSAEGADWSVLRGRKVILWPDNDEPGQKYVEAAAKKLERLGCEVFIIDVEQLGLGPKEDAFDWLAKRPEATSETLYSLPMKPWKSSVREEPQDLPENEKKISVATRLVNFALERLDLVVWEREPYAVERESGEVFLLDRNRFKEWLSSAFYETTGKTTPSGAVLEAKETLSGKAIHSGLSRPVFLRCAAWEGAYYLDLGQPKNCKAVRIEGGAWYIDNRPPILFYRPSGALPLPDPEPDGDVNLLWKHVNIPLKDRPLVLTWLLDALRPDTPFPLLELCGSAGSAKTTTQNFLRQLIDPNKANSRTMNGKRDALEASAKNNWMISFENLSWLSGEMQDLFCCIATGSGIGGRKLYTDNDEAVQRIKRPTMLNGIASVITQQDLDSRTISIELPEIRGLIEGREIEKAFERDYASILGGLLNLAAKAFPMAITMEIAPEQRPRLIDFARLGCAMEVLHTPFEESEGTFLQRMQEIQGEASARFVDGNAVATALRAYAQAPGNQEKLQKGYEVAVGALLQELQIHRPQYCSDFPKNARKLGNQLARVKPAMANEGLQMIKLGKQSDGLITWRFQLRKHEREA